MTRNILRISAISIPAVSFFLAGYVLGLSSLALVRIWNPMNGTPKDVELAFEPFWETWHYHHEEYFDQPLDDEILVEGELQGMLAILEDPNTRYLSPEDEEVARQVYQGSIEGIGAEVTNNEEGVIVIVAPCEGSPAEAAGLRLGDILGAVQVAV